MSEAMWALLIAWAISGTWLALLDDSPVHRLLRSIWDGLVREVRLLLDAAGNAFRP